LIKHWNGSTWSVVPSPGAGRASGLTAVDARLPDVWAVGSYALVSPRQERTLIEHRHGAGWAVVASPNPAGERYVELDAVAIVSANDVWAVGYATNDHRSYRTLIEHWNGESWSIVSSWSPNGHGGQLTAVSAIGVDDVWAVGTTANGSGNTLVEHWDGNRWQHVPSPNPGGSRGSGLDAISARSATDVWTVGEDVTPEGDQASLTEHWNGHRWISASTPDEGQFESLTAVDGFGQSDVWAAGWSADGPGGPIPDVEHWNGSAWHASRCHSCGGLDTSLAGISGADTHDIWAVGSDMASDITLHWNGSRWQQTP
jgi:hypothetical protein